LEKRDVARGVAVGKKPRFRGYVALGSDRPFGGIGHVLTPSRGTSLSSAGSAETEPESITSMVQSRVIRSAALRCEHFLTGVKLGDASFVMSWSVDLRALGQEIISVFMYV